MVHDHSMGGHDHHHELPVGSSRLRLRFYTGMLLNLVFVGVEAVYGLSTGSIALLSDAGHNLTDVVGLGLGLLAVVLNEASARGRFSYGFGKSSILISLINSVMILLGAGALAWEAISRLGSSVEVPGMEIMIVAGIGVIINTASTFLYVKGSKSDLNLRAAVLHLATDAVVSLGVVAAGALILWTGWTWVDPAISLLIVAVIALSSLGLMRDSLKLSLDATPEHINLTEVRNKILDFPGVISIHDLHIWPLSTEATAMTVHLRVDNSITHESENILLRKVKKTMSSEFSVGHITIQLEKGPMQCDPCDDSDHIDHSQSISDDQSN